MVGIFCNRTACRIRNRRPRHDSNMDRRKKRTPRASQHYRGWRAWQKSLLLPVAGEIFLLTLPFIERPYRKLTLVTGNATYQDLAAWSKRPTTRPVTSRFRGLEWYRNVSPTIREEQNLWTFFRRVLERFFIGKMS